MFSRGGLSKKMRFDAENKRKKRGKKSLKSLPRRMRETQSVSERTKRCLCIKALGTTLGGLFGKMERRKSCLSQRPEKKKSHPSVSPLCRFIHVTWLPSRRLIAHVSVVTEAAAVTWTRGEGAPIILPLP